MAYDEALAERIRTALGPRADVSEKRMFGGLAFLLDGKMFCGIAKGELMLRVGPDAYEAALAQPHARPMDFTGRPLTGYVYVGAAALRTAAALRKWVERGTRFVATVPAPKKKKKKKKKPAKKTAKKTARGRAKTPRK